MSVCILDYITRGSILLSKLCLCAYQSKIYLNYFPVILTDQATVDENWSQTSYVVCVTVDNN